MANTAEVLLRFTGDRRQLAQVIAAVRGDLSGLSAGQVTAVRNASQQTVTETTRAEQRRLAETVKSANQRLKEEQRAAREVARIVAETARQAERPEKLRERAAKQLADVQIREAKRAAKELEKSLKQSRGSGGGSFDDITTAAGALPVLGRVASQLSAVTTATQAAGASSLALVGPIGLVVAGFVAQAAAAGAVVKGLVDLTKSTADYRGKLFDLSQQLGVTVETLSAFEILASTTGGSLDTVSGSLAIFQRNLEDTRDPLSQEAQLLKELGVTAVDTEGALQQTLAGLFALGEGAKQTDATLQLFGRSGRFINAILKESDGDLEKAKRRFRELGIEISTGTAQAADRLNDSLAELNFQAGATVAILVEQAIPALTEIVRTTGDLLTVLRPVTSLLGSTVGATARAASASYRGLSLVVAALTFDYQALTKAIKESKEAQEIQPLSVSISPTPLPGAPSAQQTASEATNAAEVLVADAKRSAASAAAALDTLVQQGRRNREQQADETIRWNKQVLDAEINRIDTTIALKQEEFKALEEEKRKRGERFTADTAEYRAAYAAITKLQQDRLDKENEFRVQSARIRARVGKERADSERNQEQNITDILIRELDRQIKEQQSAIQRGAQAEEAGLTIIEQLERAKIDARKESFEAQKRIGFLTIEEQERINSQIKALDQEADLLLDAQRQRRLAKQHELKKSLEEFQDQQKETLRELREGVKSATQEVSEFIVKFRQAGGVIDEATERVLRFNASLIDSVNRVREMLELMRQTADAVPAPGGRVPENQPVPIDIGPPPDFSVWQETMGALREQMEEFSKFIRSTFIESLFGIADALAQGVAAWALYGGSFGKAMKQALAALGAKITAEAILQAALHAAYAIGSLAFGNFGAAAQHAIAAAKFAAIGGAAALATRALAGNDFKQSGGNGFQGAAGAGGSNAPSGNAQRGQPTPVDFSRDSFIRPPTIVNITISGEAAAAFDYKVERAVVQNINLNGEIRSMIKKEAA